MATVEIGEIIKKAKEHAIKIDIKIGCKVCALYMEKARCGISPLRAFFASRNRADYLADSSALFTASMMPLEELDAPVTAATPSVPFFLMIALDNFF